MPDLNEIIAIGAAPAALCGALFRRWVTKRRHPNLHQKSIDARRNFRASQSMTPRQREMERQHP